MPFGGEHHLIGGVTTKVATSAILKDGIGKTSTTDTLHNLSYESGNDSLIVKTSKFNNHNNLDILGKTKIGTTDITAQYLHKEGIGSSCNQFEICADHQGSNLTSTSCYKWGNC